MKKGVIGILSLLTGVAGGALSVGQAGKKKLF